MARAHAANACAQSDSIKGLAQSIAKPAYHRLLTAEPALRRAVPTLIIAFLITICLGAFVQVLDQSRQKRKAVERDLAALSDYLAERIDRLASIRQDRLATIERLQFLLPDLIPAWGIAAGRHVIVAGADRRILARVPTESGISQTDGVLDTRGEHERYGVARLKRLLCEHAGRPPERLLAELEAALDTFQVGPQADDTAAVALRPVSSAAARSGEGHPEDRARTLPVS